MRKIFGVLAGVSLLFCTSASAIDVYKGDNSVFNQYLISKGFPTCIPSTYQANVVTEEDGEPTTISQASELQAFERVWTEEDKLLKRFPDGNSLILHTEKSGNWQSVTKVTYVDGYSFLQSCVTRFL